MGQKELADIIGCSLATIQSVELGRLKLSESLASKIFVATGADPAWLLKNDPATPLTDWKTGDPYTKRVFEQVQSKQRLPSMGAQYHAHRYFLHLWARISASLVHVETRSHEASQVFMYRIERLADELEKDFGMDKPTLAAGDIPVLCKIVHPWIEAVPHVITEARMEELERELTAEYTLLPTDPASDGTPRLLVTKKSASAQPVTPPSAQHSPNPPAPVESPKTPPRPKAGPIRGKRKK